MLHTLRLHAIRLILFLFLILTAPAQAEELSDLLRGLNRSLSYERVNATPIDFDTYHPQGMTIIGDTIYLSAVHAIDRAKGEGVGYLFELTIDGKLLRSIEVGEGAMYHPGGIDFDGKHIWVSVAEYRPNSASIVYRVDPKTMHAEEMFRFEDHLGGSVSLPELGMLIGVSWGSRTFYRWNIDAAGKPVDVENPHVQKNGSHFIDYQDGQRVAGREYILFGGLASYRATRSRDSLALGGIALVNVSTLVAELEVPISLYSEKGRVMNQNPFFVRMVDGEIEFYFIPDDNASTLYTYRVKP